ncbi:MAG: protein translocase subunit SecF [Pseudomonadota bacterium]
MTRLTLNDLNIDFMGKRKIAVIISLSLAILSIVAIATRGFNFGIDFTGGTLIEVQYPESADLTEVRQTLTDAGFPEAVVLHFGTSRDVLIRIAPKEETNSAQLSNKILAALQTAHSGVELRRVEFVGPQVGEDLSNDGFLAVLFALIGIFIYLVLRFEWRFSAGAVIATLHDIIITLGFFSITGLDFDLTVVAALLAVIGYSVNDTVVVFDRIRENFRKQRGDMSTVAVMNDAINQTLSRTTITSWVTLLAVIALLLFGGDIIHSFSMTLIVGIVVGTFSSIYVASAFALMMGVSRADLLPPPKEEVEADNMP